MLRKFGIVITLVSLFIGAVIVIDLLIELAKLDEKGWDLVDRFFHHILIVYFFTVTMVGVFMGSLIWGAYINQAYRQYPLEAMMQKILLILSTLWLGFILYYLVVG